MNSTVPIDVKQPDKKLKARGLTVYIADIRSCTSREQEEARVTEEMANIRQKFSKAGKALSSYDRRKYVWKIVYTHLLGYEVDFGHIQAIELLAGQTYSEKMCGYLALTLLIKNTDELMNLVVNTMKRDLQSHNPEYFRCLALTAAANLGGSSLAPSMGDDVRRLIKDESTSQIVLKKALLCLLRLARDAPAAVSLPTELELAFLAEKDLSLTAAACALLRHVIAEREAKQWRAEEEDEPRDEAAEQTWKRQRPQVQAIMVRLLHRLAVSRQLDKKMYYNGTPNPFAQVLLLRVLVAIRTPPPTAEVKEPLFNSLRAILKGVQWSQSATVNNASRCVAFDAIALIARYGAHVPASLVEYAIGLLGRFVESKNPNTRYLALSAMCDVAENVSRGEGGDSASRDPWLVSLRGLYPTVVVSLRDKDSSVRKSALLLLFHLCDNDNAQAVVGEMLDFLRSSVYSDSKTELVLRIAILAERHARDSRWYVQTALRLIEIGGEHVTDDVWHRVAQIVANDDDVQRMASLLCYKALLSPSHVHPSTVRVASHVLGEFGYLLVESPTSGGELDHDVLPIDLFGAVHRHFQIADPATRAIMLTAYSKLLNLYAVLDEPIEEVFELVKRSGDAEVQQRAVEYARVARLQPAVMNYLLEPMPPWPHDRQSPLLRRLAQAEAAGVRSVRSAAASQNPTATAAAKLPLPAPAAAAASASAAEEDAHSSDDEARGKAAAPADSTSDARPLLAAASAAVASDLDRLFLNAMLIPKSLLYQDACIQVGSQQAFALGRGSMQLFVGNRSDAPLSQVFVELDLPAGTAAKLRVVQKSAVDEALPARAQATVEFELECMGPFHVAPAVCISYVAPNQNAAQMMVRVALPVMLSSFSDPVSMTASEFGSRWAALEGGERGLQAVVMLAGPAEWTAGLAKVRRCLDLLKLGRVADWPPAGAHAGTADLACASVLRTTATHAASGAQVTVGYLVRVELNEQARAARCSVRAAHPAVAACVMPILVAQLERMFD